MLGWTFSKTRITDEYDYAAFLRDRPGDAIDVLIMNEDGEVEFCASDRDEEPEPGDTIVYFGREKPLDTTS